MSLLPRSWTAARLGLAALALAACGWLLLRALRVHQPPRALLLSPQVEGLGPALGRGLARLIMDEMEVSAGATVLGSKAEPQELIQRLEPGDLLIRLAGRRDGDDLGLELSWIAAGDQRQGRAWHGLSIPPGPPQEALAGLIKAWPLPARFRSGALAPKDPRRFWALMEEMSVADDQTALDLVRRAKQLTAEDPASAAAWATLGEVLYRSLWVNPGEATSLPQNEALDAFDHALALVPGYPRAAFMRGMMQTDVGNQREALIGLVEARRMRPWVPDLYSGLAYAGRTSGLLDGAQAALHARDGILSPLPAPTGWFAENTWLYTGQWDRFDASLRAALQTRRDPVFLFYLGYLALLRKDAAAARPFFDEGAAIPELSLPFRDLCRVYAAALDGRDGEALSGLQALEASRGSLRIPDGEFTFKVAEAYAFLDRRDLAIESAGRAFAQGFGCTRWYETSALFAPAREHPRWAALHQHLLERQTLLEKGFGVSDFKPSAISGFRKLLPGGR